ncbi:TetR/AcrR family transcriptional regulator [Parasphingorhabdus sp.]|uniref:TetR/AcrR family transcriptional regulator n=1 Tax=Parasphingorhabdus sp. TaxID=2709688 RepID=UPI0032675612
MTNTEDNIVLERVDRPSSQRKIAKIIAAARTEFFANGFSASSIEAIAARAEVSKVTVYSWFKTKENLFGEVVKAERARMTQKFVDDSLESESLRDILLHVAENLLNFLMLEEKVRFDRILAAEVNRDPKIGKYFLDNGPRASMANLTELLQKLVDKGEIESSDPKFSAEMFHGLVMGNMDVFLRYGEKIKLTTPEKRERAKRAVDAWIRIHQK